jgi:hypothetical protein
MVSAVGRRILVAEDEHLLAKKIVSEFAKLGVETIGPARTVEQVSRNSQIDGPAREAIEGRT